MSVGAYLFLSSGAGLMAAALLIEALAGYPKALFGLIRHPVMWIGALINVLDYSLNRTDWPSLARRCSGLVATTLVVSVAASMAILISLALPDTLAGRLGEAALAATLLAQRSLFSHVDAVASPLANGNLDAARAALTQIVGRDVHALDKSGVARAAIESLAENFSDGVIAPAFWGALLGLPGIAVYKAINTLDSMIGHRTPRHEAFGWAAARLDDFVNLVPARLTALLVSLAALAQAPRALATMLRDAGRHRSPNAGWPEAAMAGALNVRLSGPRLYHGALADEPWLNPGGRNPGAAHIRAALDIYTRAACLFGGALTLIAWRLQA